MHLRSRFARCKCVMHFGCGEFVSPSAGAFARSAAYHVAVTFHFTEPAQIEPPARNRLSIAHLMLWTLGTAIVLAYFRTVVTVNSAAGSTGRLWTLSILANSVILGVQVGGALLFGWRLCRNLPGQPSQPGHWLLLIEGFSTMVSFSCIVAMRWFDAGILHSLRGMVAMIPSALLAATGCVWALRQLRPLNGLWITVFAALATFHLMILPIVITEYMTSPLSGRHAVWLILLYFEYLPGLVALVLLIAGIRDLAQPGRDAFHWAGVLAAFARHLLQLALVLVGWLIR